MSKVSFGYFIKLFCICGILSIKAENKLKQSRIFTVINFIRMPFVILFMIFFFGNPPLRKMVFKTDVIFSNRNYSTFTKVLIRVSGYLLQVVTFSICFINFWKRNKILDFMRQVQKVEISQTSSARLKKLWRKFTAMFLILWFLVTVENYVTKMRFSFLAIACFLIFTHSYVIVTSFLCFLKAFEMFFMVMLEDFNISLTEELTSQSDFDVDLYHKCLAKYRTIFTSNEKFHEAFGIQMSLMISYVTLMTTIQVI